MNDIYHLSDLDELPLNAKLAVIGNPIVHSKSPQMQQAALDAAGIDCSYVRVEAGLGEGEFEAMVQELRARGFIGVNVTVPFKRQACAMAQLHDELAACCGAANTLRFEEGGIIEAANTDGLGFELAIQELTGRELGAMRIVLLGACGGAGSALAVECVLADCHNLTLVNRPRPELEQLRTTLQETAPQSRVRALHFDSPELQEAIAEAELIINASSLGLKEGDPLPFPAEWLQPHHVVYDIVTHETPLYRAAQERGCAQASTGLSMLLWQGAIAYQKWFGAMPAVEQMRAALAQG